MFASSFGKYHNTPSLNNNFCGVVKWKVTTSRPTRRLPLTCGSGTRLDPYLDFCRWASYLTWSIITQRRRFRQSIKDFHWMRILTFQRSSFGKKNTVKDFAVQVVYTKYTNNKTSPIKQFFFTRTNKQVISRYCIAMKSKLNWLAFLGWNSLPLVFIVLIEKWEVRVYWTFIQFGLLSFEIRGFCMFMQLVSRSFNTIQW